MLVAPVIDDDLAAAVRPKFRGVDAVEKSRRVGVFAHLEKIIDGVGVVIDGVVVKVVNVWIIGERGGSITAADFMAANVV